MCYFITVGVPRDKAEFLEEHVPRGLHVEGVANPSTLQQMARGLRTYLVTTGGCSCGLFSEPWHESEERREAQSHAEQERRLRKYERMGWSTAKIDRALRQRPTGRMAEPLVGLRGDVQRFLGELAANIGELAVVVHWYDENVQDARFTCKEGEVISPEAALGEQLRLTADEIVRIKVRR